MGIGVALGVIAAIPTGGLSLVGGALAGAAGGGVIGEFFHQGIKITNEERWLVSLANWTPVTQRSAYSPGTPRPTP
jgi:hypothetical protein